MPNDACVKIFRDLVSEECAHRIAVESRAGCPQGLTNRSFEGIVGAMMMANWQQLAATKRVEDTIRAFCGMDK
jgi:hypothetical protein